MSPNHLILCCPLPLLPSIFPRIRVFSNDLALCIRWPKYWSFNFSISPSSEYSGLISFRIDWFNLLTVQGSLKSLSAPQFEGINSLMFSILYGPILTSLHHYWKHHSFDYLDLCQKSDISLLFNTLSRCAIAFLPRRKHPIILGKAFDCMDHNKLWKIFKEMGIPDHLTCLLRNLYAKQLELDMEQTGSK